MDRRCEDDIKYVKLTRTERIAFNLAPLLWQVLLVVQTSRFQNLRNRKTVTILVQYVNLPSVRLTIGSRRGSLVPSAFSLPENPAPKPKAHSFFALHHVLFLFLPLLFYHLSFHLRDAISLFIIRGQLDVRAILPHAPPRSPDQGPKPE